MFSDQFANLADPAITKLVTVEGQTVRIPRPWREYTDSEKAQLINHKYGCGDLIVQFLLSLERQVMILEKRVPSLEDK